MTSTTEVDDTKVQYKRRQFMFVLHLIGVGLVAIVLVLILSVLSQLLTWFKAVGFPLWVQGLLIFAMTFHPLFWFAWITVSLAVKSYLLKGNMWLKCLPIAIYGVAEFGLGALGSQWKQAFINAGVILLIYVHHSLTSWWKPYAVDPTSVVASA